MSFGPKSRDEPIGGKGTALDAWDLEARDFCGEHAIDIALYSANLRRVAFNSALRVARSSVAPDWVLLPSS